MFKTIVVTILIFTCTTIKLRHQESFNIQNLSEDQSKAKNFVLDQIKPLSAQALADGEQNGNHYTFRFTGKQAPFQLTDVQVFRQQDGSYQLGKVVTSKSMPIPTGRLTKKTTVQSVKTLQDGLKNLNF